METRKSLDTNRERERVRAGDKERVSKQRQSLETKAELGDKGRSWKQMKSLQTMREL